MVLYHAVTYFQVLWIIIFHLRYHRDEKGVLILVESLENRFTEVTREKIQEIFEVYYFPYGEIGNIPQNKKIEEKNEFVERRMESLYEKYVGYDLKNFNEIYIAGYHFYFTLLLIKQKIKFHIIEEAVGMLSRPEVLHSIVQNLNSTQLELALYNGLLYSDNEYIKDKYCSLKHQKVGFYDEKAINIDVMQIMQTFDKDMQRKVLSIFIDKYRESQISEDSILLLTQHFANLKILTFEDQALIYQLYVDYFVGKKNLIIKTHPDDIMYYSKLFPSAKIIMEKFPSELLPYIFNVIPKTIGTISSTAIFSIRDIFENTIEFTPAFEKEFRKIHKYYMTLYVLKCLQCKQEIQILGCNNELMDNLTNNSDLTMNLIKWKIIDEDSMDKIDWKKPLCVDQYNGDYFKKHEKTIAEYAENIIFMNPQMMCLMKSMIPITIEKSYTQRENIFSDVQEENVFYYSYNGEKRKMVNRIKKEKQLENTGISLSKRELTEEEIKVKVLEGILSATEKRLKYYVEQERELYERIDKLESGVAIRMYTEKEKQLENELEKLKNENYKLKKQLEEKLK